MPPHDDVLRLAVDLTANLATEDRYRRVLAAVRRAIPCDAAALLRRDGEVLVPVAFNGLVPEVAGRTFKIAEHPRLAIIVERPEPTRFPADSKLPDPYDGLVLGDPHAAAHVHACLGAPLVVDGDVVGALTLDALDPRAFDGVDDDHLRALAALAAAAMRTAGLIEALERTTRRQGRMLKQLVGDDRADIAARLLGTGPAMQRLRHEIDLVGASDLAVLVTGETGVGKELVARAIHAASRRADQPFCQFNCAALPEALAESELFGHLRGAFTGAVADRAGKFEVADGGTLFLDEVGELPPSVQPKLLRALQNGEIQRVGSDRVLKVDVRVVAATNRDLAAERTAGRFRSDLYHRLAAYPLRVPALRERRVDVPVLAGAFLDREAPRLGKGALRLDAGARDALVAYEWPGNVRELEHVVTRAALRAARGAEGRDAVVTRAHLDEDVAAAGGAGLLVADGAGEAAAPRPAATGTLRERLDACARAEIKDALRRRSGVWAGAARDLGLTRGNLLRLARRLGLR